MSVLRFLTELETLGINIKLVNESLKIKAPEGVLNPALINELKSKKGEIVELLKNMQKQGKYASIEPLEKQEHYEVSPAQRRMWVLCQIEESSVAYNMPAAYILNGSMNPEDFGKAFRMLVQRHESLRTVFIIVDGEPRQKILAQNEIDFTFEEMDLRKETNANPENRARILADKEGTRVFNLVTGPLLSARLLRLEHEKYLLLLNMNHIISDGWSMGVLINQLGMLYDAVLHGGKSSLLPLKIQYKDFSAWQNKFLRSEDLLKQEAYWVEKYSDEIPVLAMPGDYPRPLPQSFAGDTTTFEIDEELTKRLHILANINGCTLYMVLLSVYNVLLSKYSGQYDIIVGSPSAGRSHPDLENIIGMFINTLAMRNYPEPGKRFEDFLQEIKKNTLEVFENQDYQFEHLVEHLDLRRDTGRNPLFDTMFVMQNLEYTEISAKELAFKPYELENKISKFDLSLQCRELDDKLAAVIEYCVKLFKKETILRFAGHFVTILEEVVRNPGIRLADIKMLSAEEKQQVLYEFNAAKADYPKDKSLAQLFAEHAARTPDRTAVIGMVPGAAGGSTQALTYRELNERCRCLAWKLLEKGVTGDTIVGLMVERSVEMVMGILGILKAGAAYLPIEPDYPPERIDYMLKDSNAKILLTIREISNLSSPQAFNNRPKGTPSHLHLSPALATCLAYIIYTSGSTGKPKGVMIEHPSVANTLWAMHERYPLNRPDVYLLKTSYVFDVSVTELFGWFLGGGRVAILEKGGEKDPEKISDIIEFLRVTHVNFVPSMFNVFVDSLNNRTANKLSGLKYIFLAGEAVLPEPVNKFRQFNLGCRLENIYGPTEAAIYGSWYSLSKWDGKSRIPIGEPLYNVKLYILDSYDHLQPPGIPGELSISGAGVARGYLNRPGLTAEKFDRDLWDLQDYQDEEEPFGQFINAFGETKKNKKVPGKIIYRSYRSNKSYIYKTGDLARWLPDGNIEFLGRIDHQVKIRGNRVELGEIENRLLKKEEIQETVVVVKEEENGDRYLCAYIAPDKKFKISELREYLSTGLPGYMIPSFFVQMDRIPLTPSGKVDRKALPAPVIEAGAAVIAPRNNLEQKLAALWSEILGVKKEVISIDVNFFDLGGNSLKATVLVSKLYKALDVKIPMVKFFKTPTIKGLAEYINELPEHKFSSIPTAEKKEYYRLSSAQKRLYFLQQIDPEATAYNTPQAVPIEGKLDLPMLERVLKQLSQRIESMRTSFEMINEESVQKIHDEVEFEIEYHESEPGTGGESNQKTAGSGYPPEVETFIHGFVKPFDLGKAPLFRVSLLKLEEIKYILLIDMHHITTDGVSHLILLKDFDLLNNDKGEELPALRIQYKDYAEWQNRQLESGMIKQQEEYWLRQFSGDIPVLDLPTDYPRPEYQSYEGNIIRWNLDKTLTGKIRRLIKETGSTLNILLIAAYNVLLAKYSGQEDIVIGTVTAGRPHADLQQVVGMFANMLAIRSQPGKNKTFGEFLDEVKQISIDTYENQDYQFDDLVSKLGLQGSQGRTPLFDTVLVVQNLETSNSQIAGEGNEPDDFVPQPEIRHQLFDLIFQVFEKNEVIDILLEYSTRLFKRSTAEGMIKHYTEILKQAVKNPDLKLKDITITHDFLAAESKVTKKEQADFRF